MGTLLYFAIMSLAIYYWEDIVSLLSREIQRRRALNPTEKERLLALEEAEADHQIREHEGK